VDQALTSLPPVAPPDVPTRFATRGFAREATIYNATQILGLAATFAWGVVLANQLGPTDYGRYATVAAFAAVCGTLLDFGFELIIVRDVARNQSVASEYMASSLWLRAIAAAAVCCLAAGCAALIGFDRRIVWLILLFYVSTSVNSFAALAGNFLQAVGLFGVVGGVTGARAVGILVVGAGMLRIGYKIPGILVMYAVGATAAALILWVVVRARVGSPAPKVDRSLSRRLVIESTPVGFAALFSVLLARVDKIALARFVSLQALGWYNAAFILIQGGMDATWTSFNKLSYPILSRASRDAKTLIATTRLMLIAAAALFIPVAAVAAILSRDVTHLLFRRPEMANVSIAISILSWTIPITIFWAILRNVQLVSGRQIAYAAQTGFGVIVNVAALAVTIPLLGWTGAGVSAVGTQAMLLYLAYRDTIRTYPRIWPTGDIALIVVICAAMVLVAAYFDRRGLPWWSAAVIALLAYAGLLGAYWRWRRHAICPAGQFANLASDA